MSLYKYTIQDISRYIILSDLTVSQEKRVRDDLWERKEEVLQDTHMQTKYAFIQQINRLKEQMKEVDFEQEQAIINKVLQDIGSTYQLEGVQEENEDIECFFKFIKLRLIYDEGCVYVRFKFRTLLRCLGYKRRTAVLIERMRVTLDRLELTCYLKGKQVCDLGEIKLDNMIMIRRNTFTEESNSI